MNITQKMVRILFQSPDGITTRQMIDFGSKNPSALIWKLRHRYDVNVQQYEPRKGEPGKYYVPPTLENVQAIKTYIDHTFRMDYKKNFDWREYKGLIVCAMMPLLIYFIIKLL